MPLVKVTDEILSAVGASSVADFQASLTTFISNAQTSAKFMAENSASLESIQASIKALEGKILTEDRVKAIVGESVSPIVAKAVSDWAVSDTGKKIIGAESSRICMESLAAIGTQPAKPAPISAAGDSPEAKATELNAAGKFEEAWKADKNLRAEFPSAKGYAAFMRANRKGMVKITMNDSTRN